VLVHAADVCLIMNRLANAARDRER
jgi:hypothetical protein